MSNQPIDIPYLAPFTAAQMPFTHACLQITPNHDAALGYELALPKTWVYAKEFGPVMDELLCPYGIGYFTKGIERGMPVISVTVTRVPFEVPIDCWTRMSVENEGWSVVAAAWFPGPHNLLFDVTARRVVDDVEWVRRTTSRLDGINIFSVHTVCLRKYWDQAKEVLWLAHATFRLTGAQGESRMEPWLRAKITNDPAFETAYPSSWSYEAVPPRKDGISGIHLRLLDPERTTLLAYVLVRAERKLSDERIAPAVLLADSMPMLVRSGVAPGELQPTSEATDPRSVTAKGWSGGFIGEARWQEADVMLRLGFLQREKLVFTIALCGPKREVDVLTMLRGTRAFEIARIGLETGA